MSVACAGSGTPADLTAAVAKFIECRPEIPFAVDRLFVAAACDSDRRQVTEELYRLAAAHPDVEIVARNATCSGAAGTSSSSSVGPDQSGHRCFGDIERTLSRATRPPNRTPTS